MPYSNLEKAGFTKTSKGLANSGKCVVCLFSFRDLSPILMYVTEVKAMDSGWRVTFRAVKCGVLASLDPYAKANGGRGRIRYSATEVLRLKT